MQKTASSLEPIVLTSSSTTELGSNEQRSISVTPQPIITTPTPIHSQQLELTANNQGEDTVSALGVESRNNSMTRSELYILFCTFQGFRLRYSQIEVAKCKNDDVFFENLRQEHKRMRGFWRHWLHPEQLDHCEFVKFTRFYVNELARVGRDLPQSDQYIYRPRPPGPHDDPPITPHEFRARFFRVRTTCGSKEALGRIPKRTTRFQVNLHVGGPENMWGLQARLRISFLIVLIWQMIITAGSWIFMGWWLSRRSGDLQNAVIPVTVTVSLMTMLWLPLGERFRMT